MTTEKLKKIDQELIWHPFAPLKTPFEYIPLKSAKGTKLITEEGIEIIDAISSWWVNIHGHSHPDIAKAIYDQALIMEHAIFAGFTHEPAIKLAQNLKSILPHASKFFFSDNGSTAVEVAIKMALQYWYNLGKKNKNRIIAIDGAYHGDTFGAMSVGERGGFTEPFFDLLFEVDFIDFPYSEAEERVFAQFESLIAKEECAAFIFEPLVQGAGGMRMYSTEFLEKLVSAAQAKGIICIADEVMTGWGRTGTNFACDQIKSTPDISCVSKGITGGTMPLGITACNEKIEKVFQSEEYSKALLHGHSYTGNPLACAAANASFNIFMDDKCKMNRVRINRKHQNFLQKLQKNDKVENCRVTGTILAFDLKGFGETGYNSSARQKIYPYFLEKGILIRPLGNVIYLLPPYIITDEELNYIYEEILIFLKMQ